MGRLVDFLTGSASSVDIYCMGSDRPNPRAPSDPVFAQLFQQCAAAIRRSFRRLRIPDSDLPDLEQDTWLAISKALGRQNGAPLSEPERFSATIAYRRGLDRLKERRRSPEQAASPDDPEPIDPRPSSEEQMMQSDEERQARALVLRLLDDLPVSERAVVVLADFEPHRSMGEIAEELDISEEAARSRHRRAHERMRQSLERQKQKAQPVLACGLLPAVAALSLDELLSIEAPAPPLSPREQARVWDRVMLAIGGNAPALAGAVTAMLTAKQAAAVTLLAFALGAGADEAWRAVNAPTSTVVAAERAPVVVSVSAPLSATPTVDPSPIAVAVAAPTTTPAPTLDLGPEWQALHEARALLRGKQPAPEAALAALKRVRAPQLHDLREQLRAEAESMARAEPTAQRATPR